MVTSNPCDTLFPQTYDPTIEDAYRKSIMVDNKMCFIEVIDTAGQGEKIYVLGAYLIFTPIQLEEYATLRDQWVRCGACSTPSFL